MGSVEENDLGADLDDGAEPVAEQILPGKVLQAFLTGMANNLKAEVQLSHLALAAGSSGFYAKVS